jgi:3-dehydroshikimate dehydratase
MRARVQSVGFLEFAADETEVQSLETLFATLGFSRGGKHRTKNVARWRQNGINFVINGKPDSFARKYDAVHGASVRALGLSIEDVASAVRRAQAC